MKLILIGNCIYIPILNSNKYQAGSISGVMFTSTYTLDEIKERHSTAVSLGGLKECNDLHDLCKQWGTK